MVEVRSSSVFDLDRHAGPFALPTPDERSDHRCLVFAEEVRRDRLDRAACALVVGDAALLAQEREQLTGQRIVVESDLHLAAVPPFLDRPQVQGARSLKR